MYLFQPFINTFHMVLVVAGKNPDLVSVLVLGKANVTPNITNIIEQEKQASNQKDSLESCTGSDKTIGHPFFYLK